MEFDGLHCMARSSDSAGRRPLASRGNLLILLSFKLVIDLANKLSGRDTKLRLKYTTRVMPYFLYLSPDVRRVLAR